MILLRYVKCVVSNLDKLFFFFFLQMILPVLSLTSCLLLLLFRQEELLAMLRRRIFRRTRNAYYVSDFSPFNARLLSSSFEIFLKIQNKVSHSHLSLFLVCNVKGLASS
ncbi:GPI-anchored surface protein, putative [Bodo saltans]|uniref:GPI-anchored surface protein, putative n=1 Tax=Bodo saltans TaxID=75058 RepID=A0A0S4IPR9_BODSA|nr:GPI-anchored surface protein, putative [Bodo saltans]|eukprot:CUF88892.1 GPI-anchored surface protein, putative [Bodo saltans]